MFSASPRNISDITLARMTASLAAMFSPRFRSGNSCTAETCSLVPNQPMLWWLKHLLYLILHWRCATLRLIIFCCTGMFMWILPGLWLFHSYTICTTSKHSTAVYLCVSTADDRQYFMKLQFQRHKKHSYQHDFQISVTKIWQYHHQHIQISSCPGLWCSSTNTKYYQLLWTTACRLGTKISVSQMFLNNALNVPAC